jgi:hypothetical protein
MRSEDLKFFGSFAFEILNEMLKLYGLAAHILAIFSVLLLPFFFLTIPTNFLHIRMKNTKNRLLCFNL